MNHTEETYSLTTAQRCPDCDHTVSYVGGGICIGCPCASEWHSEVSKLKRELEAKHVPQTPKDRSTHSGESSAT